MAPLQYLSLGTATSTSLPLTPCLTLSHSYPESFTSHVPHSQPPPPGKKAPPGYYDPAGPWPRNVQCACCRSAVDPDVPEGWKNKRGNTSAVIRRKGSDGKWRNILLDCGKTFLEQAKRFFPRWGVQTIDAVLLTHGHADAFFGLDDLREWCIRQGYAIPIYLNQATFEIVGQAFPYLIDKNKASGGGDVPTLIWNVIDDYSSFEVCGVAIEAMPVHHGIYFTDAPEQGKSSKEVSKAAGPRPLICLAFFFDKKVLYMADVSDIPEKTWQKLLGGGGGTANGVTNGIANGHTSLAESEVQNAAANSSNPNPVVKADTSPISNGHSAARIPILVIDALWPLKPHLSHFQFSEALETTLRLKPEMTYLLGMTHPTTHFMWEEICRSLDGEDGQRPEHPCAENSRWLVEKVKKNKMFAGGEGIYSRWGQWRDGKVEPAWDGLVLEIDDEVGEDGRSWREVNGPGGSVGGWGI